MRVIKFRAKRKDNSNWVYGDLWTNLTSPNDPLMRISTWIKENDSYDNYEYTVDPATVGHFTGLRDKNGKEIYEGDILRGFQKDQSDNEGKYGFDTTDTVYWHNGGFKVFGKSLQDGYTKDGNILYQFMWCNPGHFATPDYYYQLDDIEIIGNIHQLTPSQKGDVNYNMKDPNVKAEEATNEQANAQESEGQDKAMGADSEEGSVEG